MNWSKAKNILIMAFLVTNLILGINLYRMHQLNEKPREYSEVYRNQVFEILNNNDITLATELPPIREDLTAAIVEYQLYKPEQIAKRFFENPSRQPIEDRILFVQGSEELEIINNKELVYKNNSPNLIYETMDENTALTLAEEFLRDRGLYDENADQLYLGKTDMSYELLYTKTYEGVLVEESKMTFGIDRRGIFEFTRLWIEDVKPNLEKPVVLEDPLEALLKLMTEAKLGKTTIIDLRPCYYLGRGKNKVIDYNNAKRGEGTLAWRVLLSDGRKYFYE